MTTIFGAKMLSEYLNEREKTLIDKINAIDEAAFHSMNIDVYANNLENGQNINVPVIDKGNIETDIRKGTVRGFRSSQVDIAIYKIPFEGDSYVFSLMPSTFTVGLFEYGISGKYLIFEINSGGIINNSAQVKEHVKNSAQQCVTYIEGALVTIKRDIDNFNHTLHDRIIQYLNTRKQYIESKNQLKKDINPFKK